VNDFIAVVYNESDEFLIRTLSAVFRNIRFFCEINKEYRARNNAQPSGNSPPPIGRTPDMAFARSKNTPSRPHLEDGLRGEQIWNEDGWQKIVVSYIILQYNDFNGLHCYLNSIYYMIMFYVRSPLYSLILFVVGSALYPLIMFYVRFALLPMVD
jgi:hypothetical protein